jgi:drug/metabolite transporter (DMT)-like permease
MLVAISSLAGGVLQLLARRVFHGDFQSALNLPWKLWAVPIPCFVIYGLVWPAALTLSPPDQVVGVSLINYLWPVLTVCFSALLVPGVKLSPRLLAAMGLVLCGLVLANYRELSKLGFREILGNPKTVLPAVLALTAAVTWALYCAILARWKDWSNAWVTSPIGFILTGVVACLVLPFAGVGTRSLSTQSLGLILLYGAGPLAAGYLLWELAITRARVERLGLIAAATPILATLWLSVFLRRTPGFEVLLAAGLISTGVVLSREKKV